MANEQDRLTAQLSHISIGSLDDTLSRKLHDTHISNTAPPTTSLTSPSISNPTTPWPSEALNRPTADTLPWQTTSQAPPTAAEEEDGWGDAPAYTSILPYTQFGFTSMIVPSQSPIPSSSTLKKNTLSLDPNQPFSRHSHQSISFASFASPPPNNASVFDQ
ncbi:hypothetical protein BCR42DRAFT_433009 [Absidia repens]|uniref:Uncharacterized protein n=1 Tax=Absidia repens TaxID=90262 RepID=A0A1X2IXZ6_9FUNG|nr:hypothetical protein BCR42DRAFT_433009 [Absidia repens]